MGHGGGQDGEEAEPKEACATGRRARAAAGGEIADDGHGEILFKRVTGADDPQGGDGERELEALGPRRIDHTGVLPLPAAALDHFEPVLNPGADTIPGGGTVRR